MNFKGAIFDLDGVIVNTVPLHFKAWKKMFEEYGREFTFQDYKSKVDGISGIDGARAILTDLNEQEIINAYDRKQAYFLEYLKEEGINVYQTSVDLIKQLKNNSIKIAIISSSKNCSYILKRIAIYKFIDAEVNGNDITQGKPDPQIFLIARDKLGLQNKECIIFEDASLGVEAAKRANIFTVGIDRYNDAGRLEKADLIVKDLEELNFNKLKTLI